MMKCYKHLNFRSAGGRCSLLRYSRSDYSTVTDFARLRG